MKLIKSKKGVALLAALAVAVVAAVGAYAYFTSTGTGSGTATVGTSTAWAVTTGTATGGPLTPGGPSEAIAYHVKNNSSGNQGLANVNIQIATTVAGPPVTAGVWTVSGGSTPDCTKGDFQLSKDGGLTWAAAGASIDDTALAGNIGPGATVDGSIQIRMINKVDDPGPPFVSGNQDNCKNATVPLFLSAS